MTTTQQPAPVTIAPAPFCQTHQSLLVRQCAYKPEDPWRVLMIVSTIAMVQGAAADPRVREELESKIENIGRLGCLACRKPDLFGVLVDRVQNTSRECHFAEIKALGERWCQEGAAP